MPLAILVGLASVVGVALIAVYILGLSPDA
jgi:hypothetical protein